MRRSKRQAFTLVELLVVIGIIGTLAGLLLPAVLGAMEETRRMNCVSNLKNMYTATMLYEKTHNKLPGYAATVATTNPDIPSYDIGWAPQLFAYLDMPRQAQQLIDGNWNDTKNAPEWASELKIFICPSENPEIGGVISDSDSCGESGDEVTLRFPLSYAVNSGRIDRQRAANDSPPGDTRQYAVFHDHREFSSGAIKNRKVPFSLEDIEDGLAQTMLFSENVSQTEYTAVSEPSQAIVYDETVNLGEIPDTDEEGDDIETFKLGNINSLKAPGVCSENLQDDEHVSVHLQDGNRTLARPVSYHQNGFNVLYANGQVRFFVIDAENLEMTYALYRTAMTPGDSDKDTEYTNAATK